MILGEVSFSIQPAQLVPEDGSLFLCFQQGQVLLGSDGGNLIIPTYAMVKPLLPEGLSPFELAHTQQQTVFIPDPLKPASIPEGCGLKYESLRSFRHMPFDAGAIITSASHLWNWYRRNHFCGACSMPLTHCADERALRCPACGELFFPMIAPAVIVAITCGDYILVARNAHSEWKHYALIAGYVEVGETTEHAVRREVLEEVGLEIHAPRYLGDQPWGISGSLMFAFHAEADMNAPIRLQESELSDAKWLHRDEIEPDGRPVSIAGELLERFRTGRL